MKTREAVEVANVIDRFPVEYRLKMRNALMRMAEVYKATGVSDIPLDELRRRYREEHPDEQPAGSDNVVDLDARRRARSAP